MQSLKGIFPMLYSLALQSNIEFNLHGSCPSPPEASFAFEDDFNLSGSYLAGLYFNSQIDKNLLFSVTEPNDLYCVSWLFKNRLKRILEVTDCVIFTGYLNYTSHGNYDFLMVHSEPPKKGKKIYLENMRIWTDKTRKYFVFWKCIENSQKTSHHQSAVVFVGTELINPKTNGNLSFVVYQEMVEFFEETMEFANIPKVTDRNPQEFGHDFNEEKCRLDKKCEEDIRYENENQDENQQGLFIILGVLGLLVLLAVLVWGVKTVVVPWLASKTENTK